MLEEGREHFLPGAAASSLGPHSFPERVGDSSHSIARMMLARTSEASTLCPALYNALAVFKSTYYHHTGQIWEQSFRGAK